VTRGFAPLLAVVLAAGLGALSWATEDFRVVTSEGARRVAVEHRPIPLPDVRMIDQDGHSFSLAGYRGRPVLVDFIYTRCPTICGVRGDDFRALLSKRGPLAAGGIALLSIGFDLDNDDLKARQLYAERYSASAPRWRIGSPADRRSLATLLASFGEVVISDGFGGFVHSGALYLVDPRGRLARILDPEMPAAIASAVQAVL
jgi:protein SCO1